MINTPNRYFYAGTLHRSPHLASLLPAHPILRHSPTTNTHGNGLIAATREIYYVVNRPTVL